MNQSYRTPRGTLTDEEARDEMQRAKDELDNFNLFVFKGFAITALGIILIVIVTALFSNSAHAQAPAITAGEQYESEVSVCANEADAQAVLTADIENGYFSGLAVFNEKCTVYTAKWAARREVASSAGSLPWHVHEIEVREVYVEKKEEWAKNAVPEVMYYITLNPLRRKTA